jgi:hypothetical protein
MTEEVKGISYIDPIHKAYDALVASHRNSLRHALELGKLLHDAKEAVGHGGWAKWLKTNCPQISHRTANVYMNLEKHRDKFDKPSNSQRAANSAAQDDLSIRAAIDAVNKADGGGLKTKEKKGKEEKNEKPDDDEDDDSLKGFDVMGHKADLVETLKAVAPDEVSKAINDEWEPEDREELLRQQLKSCPPTALSDILISALGRESVQALIATLTKKLTEHIAAPVADTSSVRRGLGAAVAATP